MTHDGVMDFVIGETHSLSCALCNRVGSTKSDCARDCANAVLSGANHLRRAFVTMIFNLATYCSLMERVLQYTVADFGNAQCVIRIRFLCFAAVIRVHQRFRHCSRMGSSSTLSAISNTAPMCLSTLPVSSFRPSSLPSPTPLHTVQVLSARSGMRS